jgi:hypothetical protein
MATVDKRLCSGTLSATNATLYTAPSTAGSFVVIKAITLCNKTASMATVTLKLDGIEVVAAYPIEARDTITIPFIDHILEASELIEGLAGTASAINYYISGKEVS